MSVSASGELGSTTGDTALHSAVRRLDLDGVQKLLRCMENVDVRNASGRTALHAACEQSGSGSVDVVRVLLAAGAHGNAQDNQLMSPLHVACQCSTVDVVKALLNV